MQPLLLEIGDQKQAIAKWAELGQVLLEQTTPESDKYQRWQQVMLHLLGVYAEVFTSVNPLPEGPRIQRPWCFKP